MFSRLKFYGELDFYVPLAQSSPNFTCALVLVKGISWQHLGVIPFQGQGHLGSIVFNNNGRLKFYGKLAVSDLHALSSPNVTLTLVFMNSTHLQTFGVVP